MSGKVLVCVCARTNDTAWKESGYDSFALQGSGVDSSAVMKGQELVWRQLFGRYEMQLRLTAIYTHTMQRHISVTRTHISADAISEQLKLLALSDGVCKMLSNGAEAVSAAVFV